MSEKTVAPEPGSGQSLTASVHSQTGAEEASRNWAGQADCPTGRVHEFHQVLNKEKGSGFCLQLYCRLSLIHI